MTAINAEKNEITVGVKSQLYEEEFFVSGASWYLEPESPFEAEIQIRYRHEAVMGEIERLEGGRAAVRMNVPQTAVTLDRPLSSIVTIASSAAGGLSELGFAIGRRGRS